MSGGWHVEHVVGTAAEVHARDITPGGGRQVWVMVVDRPALVLGSTQSLDEVDPVAAERRGVDVVRRRSGGGAVMVEPGGTVWVDVVVPPGDPLWDDDVGRAAHWLGRAWATAVRSVAAVDAVDHVGPLVTTPWSRLVCFAGLGPGEVTVDGRKVVGLSQRRTRHGARFQTAALLRWEPGELLDLLRLDADDRAAAAVDVGPRAAALTADAPDLVDALLAALPTA